MEGGSVLHAVHFVTDVLLLLLLKGLAADSANERALGMAALGLRAMAGGSTCMQYS